MRSFIKGFLATAVTASLIFIGGCSHEVGSEAWCEDMKEKPRGDWTANEAGNFARHCVIK